MKYSIKSKAYVLPALTLALLSSLSAQGAPLPPDAGQTLRELQQQPALSVPKAATPLSVEGDAAGKGAANDKMRITVKAIRVSGNKAIATAELEVLLAGLTGGEHSLAELDAGAARITAYYRSRGYAVARAYLPEQEIKDGVVMISVLEGVLGEQRIGNKSRLSDERVNGYLSASKSGDAIQSAPIDRALLLLNDTPGVGGSRASLQPGASVGTADLIVELTPSAPYSASVELDNYGNRYTGQNRLGAGLALNSPLGIGDQLMVRAIASEEAMRYARLAYQLPVGSNGLKLGAAYSGTSYKLAKEFASLQAHGSATSASVYAVYPLVRSQASNLTTTLSWESKKLKDETDTPVSLVEKDVQLASLGLAGNHQDSMGGAGVTSFDLTLASGKLGMDAATLATDSTTAQSEGNFSRLNYNLARLQRLSDSNILSLAISGQQAGKNLNSSEKFILGGANGVRAYPQGEGSGDAGWLANLELRHSVIDGVQGLVFYDAGSVTLNHTPYTSAENSRSLAGSGVGVNALYKSVQLKTAVAWRSYGGVAQSEPASEDRNPRLWMQLSGQF